MLPSGRKVGGFGNQSSPSKPFAITGIIARILMVIVAASVILADFESWTAIPKGSRCKLRKAAYGTRDVDKARESLENAQKIHDEWGISELSNADLAVLSRRRNAGACDRHGIPASWLESI